MKTRSQGSSFLLQFCSAKGLVFYIRSVIAFVGLYMIYSVDANIVSSIFPGLEISSAVMVLVLTWSVKMIFLLEVIMIMIDSTVRSAVWCFLFLIAFSCPILVLSYSNSGFWGGVNLIGIPYLLDGVILLFYILLCVLGLKNVKATS